MHTPLIQQLKILPSRRRRAAPTFAMLAMIAVAACSPMLTSNGFIPDDVVVEKLRPGVHDRGSVTALFGSPTSISDFNGETWLYVKRESEQVAFFKEKLVEQAVLAVRFNAAGVVKNVKKYAMVDGKIVDLVERKTATRGRELTVIEQLFGNIGRFSNQAQ